MGSRGEFIGWHTETERGIVKYSGIVTRRHRQSARSSLSFSARHLLLFLILLLFLSPSLSLFSFFFSCPQRLEFCAALPSGKRARRDNSRHFQICRCQGIGKNNSPSIAIDQSARRQKLRSKKNIGNNGGRKLLGMGQGTRRNFSTIGIKREPLENSLQNSRKYFQSIKILTLTIVRIFFPSTIKKENYDSVFFENAKKIRESRSKSRSIFLKKK